MNDIDGSGFTGHHSDDRFLEVIWVGNHSVVMGSEASSTSEKDSAKVFEGLFGIVRTMFKDAWDQRLGQAKASSQAAQTETKKLDKQIDSLVDRIVVSQNDRVTKAYESRIAKLEREKIRVEETIAKSGKSKHTFEELFEL